MNQITTGIKLKGDASGLVGETKRARKEFDRFTPATKRAGKGAETATRQVKALKVANGRLASSVRASISPIGLAANAMGAFMAAISLVKLSRTADAMTRINNQLRLVTTSTNDFNHTQSKLIELANSTYSDLDATVALYTKMHRATRNLNVSQGDLMRVTRAINQSFQISGASAEEAAGSTRQLAQALASGTFRGDEFNSVAEQAPRLMQALQAETGKTAGELRDMAAKGQLTSELLINALKNQAASINDEYGKMKTQIGQALTVLSNRFTVFVGEIDAATGASTAAVAGFDAIGRGVDDLTASIASGEMGGYLDALAGKFSGFSQDATRSLKIVSDFIDTHLLQQVLALEAVGGEALKFLGNAFVNFPENVRAMVQILTVELASLIDVGAAYGQAFAQAVGTKLAELVDKVGIYARELGDLMQFWDGDTYDHTAALAKASQIADGMTNTYLDAAQRQVQISRDARQATINHILLERDAALDSYAAQIAAAQSLGDAHKNDNTKGISDSSSDSSNVVSIATGQAVTDTQLQNLREGLMSQEEVLQAHLTRKQALIQAALEQEKIDDAEAKALMIAANDQHHQRLQAMQVARANLILSSSQQIFSGLTDLMAAFGGKQSKAYKVMFMVQKGFAIAQGILNLTTAISQASTLPWPTNIPAMAQAAATGASLVATIKSAKPPGQAHDGIRRVNRDNEGTYVVRRDEMVLNPRQRENFEQVAAVAKGGGLGSGRVYNMTANISIDARGAEEGVEEKVQAQVKRAIDEYDVTLQQDFANNGHRSQMLSGKAA